MKTIYNFLRSGLAMALLFSANSAWSNNIQVSNVTLVNQNTSAGPNHPDNHTFVRFDLNWDNSWRTITGPGNYDAAWVFVKFQPFGGNYDHATLSNVAVNHTVTTNNGVPAEFKTVPDGVGVFVQRANNGGPGSNNWQDVLVRWDYPANGVQDNQSVTVQVFAVEMVFIPEGSFYLGDGNINQNPSSRAFRINNQPNTTPQGKEAYLVTSENAITFVNSTSTDLTGVYDINVPNGYALSANYPKGFRAFYTMKYEVSQKQYVDFFNTLPTAPIADPQKAARNITRPATSADRNNFLWSNNNLDDANLDRFGTTPPAQGSGDRAQNWVSWLDASAYLDWSGLRPMSEFEYEKMCRGNDVTYGPIYPINGEYAWGSLSLTAVAAGALAGAAQADNTISENLINAATNQANAHVSNQNLNNGAVAGNRNGPVRSGIFAAKNFTTEQRRQAGASFYGVMELTGNVREFVIQAGHQRSTSYGSPASTFGSQFTQSIHGDGIIPNGNCNIDTWTNNAAPSSNLSRTSVGHRGGTYILGGQSLNVSARPAYLLVSGGISTPWGNGTVDSYAISRTIDNGIRGVRSTFVP